MTVEELLNKISSKELVEWMAIRIIEDEEEQFRDQKQKLESKIK